MSPPLSSSFALATFVTLFIPLLACLAIPVVHGQSAGLGLVQCAPAQVQVGGGSGPYTVSVLPAGADGQLATDAEPLETFPALNQSGVASWLVNVPSGTTVRLGVRDGTGAVSYSDPFTVQSGSSNDCLPASSAVPTSSATVASSTSALSSSPSSFASSQPESSASRISLTTTTGSSSSGSVMSSLMSSSSLRPSSSLTGSVTTQLNSSFASLSTTTTHPSISSTSSSTRTSSSSSSMTSSASAIDPSATNQLSSGASSLRPYTFRLTTWLSAALLLLLFSA